MSYVRSLIFLTMLIAYTVLLFTLAAGPYLFYTVFRRRHASDFAHKVACVWGRGFFLMTPGWSFSIEGSENLPTSEPVIYVANHQSAADIVALLALNRQFRWLSKDTVFKLPVIGHVMRWAGYIAVTRGNPASHKKALEESARWLQRGVSMAYFPEGSRSLDGNLKPFKSGAFRLSESENVHVVPIAITGTKDLVPARSLAINTGHVKLKVLPKTAKQQDESLESFVARVRDEIAKHLK